MLEVIKNFRSRPSDPSKVEEWASLLNDIYRAVSQTVTLKQELCGDLFELLVPELQIGST